LGTGEGGGECRWLRFDRPAEDEKARRRSPRRRCAPLELLLLRSTLDSWLVDRRNHVRGGESAASVVLLTVSVEDVGDASAGDGEWLRLLKSTRSPG
jgi:hypothetical protein